MSVQLHNLRPNEQVDMVVRRHWIAFAFIGVYALAGIFFTFCLLYVIQ